MRKKLAGTLAVAVAVAAAAVAVVAFSAPGAQAAASDPYTWKNVQIAGGGFVPGVIFNQTEQNLIYSRTDIGGAYRWEQSTQKWTPLLDFVGQSNWGYNGVVSLATDPVQTSKVYVAVGMYTNSWDPNNGAVLRSSDKGATWATSPLPFKLGGNMPGRGMGERLAIDPNRNSVLYLGAPSGNGLWKSTDSGVTWAKVANFPNVGTYVQGAGDPYLGDNQGIAWVTFDKSTGTSGNLTQGIYVGVADKANTVYRSVNGGTSWERIAGQPTGYLAHKGVIDTVNHILYITTSDTGGPYDGAKGDVWKYNITTGVWTQISPILSSSTDDYFGYSGLTIDRQNPNTIMVATQISWWPDAIFFRSTDAGATWTRIWDFTSYPSRSFRYTQNITSVPWLSLGANPSPPEVTPKLGWMNESLEIDPFNGNRMMYGTGATLYGTNNLKTWDTGGQITITPMVSGLEETAVLDLISPPTGAPLISGLGDIGGFRHTNLDAVPAMMFQQPYFTSTTSLDYAETNPATMVRSGNFTDSDRPNDSHVAFSTDGGANWFQGSEPGGVNNGGTVAAAADGSRFVWAPGDAGIQVVYSVGFGNTWTTATGVPANSIIEADRVNAQKFYAFSNGTFYVSTNGGAAFTATGATGLPTTGVHFKALPGVQGDIWLAGSTGLFHSTNSGTSFTKVSTVTSAINVGFGKAAPGQTYQALYLVGNVDGVDGVYRSDNAGVGWVRINDNAHQYGNMGEALTGDPRIYGRVYLGTNGRGVLYADKTGTTTTPPADTTVPSTPGTPTASAVTSTGATLSWTASTDNVGVAGYNVYRRVGTTDTQIAQSTTNSVVLTGLTASTAYSVVIRARDAAGNLSATSGAASFTTSAPTTDTTVPSTPGTPTASAVTSTGATLSWTASTDNVGVAGYNVYRRVGTTDTQIAQSTTNSVVLTGLTASTAYSVVIRARDAAGNLSATSGAGSFTTSATGGGGSGGCSAAYSITGSWSGGFQGSVTVTNTATTASTAWTVTWTFANGQSISQIWGGILTQSGASETVKNETYNGTLAANATATFGFLASWNGTNAIPTLSCTRTP